MKLIEKLAKEWCETPVHISFTCNGVTTDCGTGTHESLTTYHAAYGAGFRKAKEMILSKLRSMESECAAIEAEPECPEDNDSWRCAAEHLAIAAYETEMLGEQEAE